MPNFTFCGGRARTQDNNFLFLFLNLHTVLSNSTPEKINAFNKFNEIEEARIYFSKVTFSSPSCSLLLKLSVDDLHVCKKHDLKVHGCSCTGGSRIRLDYTG